MKLLFAIKRLENMAGGAERVVLQVIDGLRREGGHDMTLITFDRPDAQSFYPFPEGIKWIRLGVGDSAKRAGFVETIKRMWALRQYLRQIKPDVVVPFQHSMFVPMVLAMTGMKAPIIASEHIVPDHYRSRPLEYILLVLTGLKCRKITVLSEVIIRMYPKCLWSRMVAVPNPVETSDAPADVVGQVNSRKILISVGRLDPQKDQKTLVDAFALLAKDFPDWDLKIFGEGLLRPELEAQIRSLGLEGRITLPGLSRNILSEFQASQAFVLASRYEAFGLATAEAMSAGLPVIGFADCAGTNELIKHQRNGLLVQVDAGNTRAASLAESLKTLLSDVSLREKLGAQARQDMLAFSQTAVIKQWQGLIDSIVSR